MASFEYEALTAEGRRRQGVIQSDSARQARERLRQQGLTPLRLSPVAENETARRTLRRRWRGALPTAELALFLRQLQTLLEAGTPLAQALYLIARQSPGRRLPRFATQLHDRVEAGYSFAAALEKAPWRTPATVVAAVRAGEESGHLDKVLAQLADDVEKQEALQRTLRTAMIYPALMAIVSTAIVIFLMTYVMPKVLQTFASLDQPLPALTERLVALSLFLQRHGLPLLGGLAILTIGLRQLLQRPRWRSRWHALLLRLPLIRRLIQLNVSARWSRTLGMLTGSGVPMVEALKIAAQVIEPLPLRQRADAMVEQVRQGHRLSEAMTQAGFFPLLLVSLVQSGEHHGQLDAMLLKGAERYEQELTQTARAMVSLLEPMMIVIMGGVVLLIVLAIMLPIFSMNQMVKI